jgi:hypothetical protein
MDVLAYFRCLIDVSQAELLLHLPVKQFRAYPWLCQRELFSDLGTSRRLNPLGDCEECSTHGVQLPDLRRTREPVHKLRYD